MFSKLKTISTADRIDYFLMYLLISISGNWVFTEPALIPTFIMAFLVFLYRKKSFDLIFILFVGIMTIVLLLQAIKFDFLPIVTLIGHFIRVFTAYFIVKSIGPSFVEKFIRVMVVLALISFPFWIASNTIPGLVLMMKPYALHAREIFEPTAGTLKAEYHIGIHHFRQRPYNPFSFIRNCGSFWEPGAYSGYMMIAMIFSVMKNGVIITRSTIVLMLAIISAVSTTGLVALMALIFFHILLSSKFQLLKPIILPFAILLGVFTFTYFDFIGAKIEDRIKLAEDPAVIYSQRSSRFVDAVRDWHALKGHEILGRGLNKETRLSKLDKQTGYTIRTNGLTDNITKWGIPFWALIFVLLYYSLKLVIVYYEKISKYFAFSAIFIIILLLQAEVYFNFPLFWALLFLYSVYNQKNKEKECYI